MFKRSIMVCLICLPLICAVFGTTVSGSSFGDDSDPVISTSFKDFFKDNFEWHLEYDIGNGWTSGNQFMSIEKSYDSLREQWKWNLIFNNNYGYVDSARFTFGINMREINGSIDKVNEVLYFDIANYSCYFDYSDLMSIPGIEFSYGKLPGTGWFWFRFKKDGIPLGVYEFDPWFGNQDGYNVGLNFESKIVGYPVVFSTTKKYAFVDDISAYIRGTNGNNFYYMCGLYVNSTKALIGKTEYRIITGNNSYHWYKFDFDTRIDISGYSGQELLIVCHSDTGAGDSTIGQNTSSGFRYIDNYVWDFDLSDPFAVTTAQNDRHIMIYCNYTEFDNRDVSISSFNVVNNSCVYNRGVDWSCAIIDPDGHTFNVTMECNNEQVFSMNNTGNDTFVFKLRNLIPGEMYTVWVNSSDNGTSQINNSYRFTYCQDRFVSQEDYNVWFFSQIFVIILWLICFWILINKNDWFMVFLSMIFIIYLSLTMYNNYDLFRFSEWLMFNFFWSVGVGLKKIAGLIFR